jgi:hypothetical protein
LLPLEKRIQTRIFLFRFGWTSPTAQQKYDDGRRRVAKNQSVSGGKIKPIRENDRPQVDERSQQPSPGQGVTDLKVASAGGEPNRPLYIFLPALVIWTLFLRIIRTV